MHNIFSGAGMSDAVRGDNISRDTSSGSSRRYRDGTREPVTPADTVFTQESGYLSLVANSSTTGPTSGIPSTAENTAASFDLFPRLVTPPGLLTASEHSEEMVTSASVTSSSSPSKRPDLNRTRSYREDRRAELLRRLDSEDRRAVEALIDVEATRKCRQALIDIEEDTVFAKAMSQVLKQQFPPASMGSQDTPRSPHQSGSRPELQKDAIKASFLVREILLGERSYVAHLENGVKVSYQRAASCYTFSKEIANPVP